MWSACRHGFENFHLGDMVGMPEYMNGVWYVCRLTMVTAYPRRQGRCVLRDRRLCLLLDAGAGAVGAGSLAEPAEMLTEMGTSMPGYLRITLFRPLGIGMLIGGALTGIALALPLVVSAIRSMHSASKMKTDVSRDEMPIRLALCSDRWGFRRAAGDHGGPLCCPR